MHRAILISSHYPATSGYPNHAYWAETSEQVGSRLSEQGYQVEPLSSGGGLVERLRSALRHEDKQASLLLHFTGYLLLTESGDPALLLADENVTALRLTQLIERSARRFGRVLLIVDAVRGSSTRTIAQASGESRRVPEDSLARMAVECAKQVDNVTMLVGVRPWGDDEEDDGHLSKQLDRALRQLATIPDWHSSHDLEEWLEDHADSASFVLRSHHCDPAFPLFPRRPYPSSPHAPPLPKTLGPGDDKAGSTSLDELAAMIRAPHPSTSVVEPAGRPRAKVQALPTVPPPVAVPPPAVVPPPPPAALATPAAVIPPKPPAAAAPATAEPALEPSTAAATSAAVIPPPPPAAVATPAAAIRPEPPSAVATAAAVLLPEPPAAVTPAAVAPHDLPTASPTLGVHLPAPIATATGPALVEPTAVIAGVEPPFAVSPPPDLPEPPVILPPAPAEPRPESSVAPSEPPSTSMSSLSSSAAFRPVAPAEHRGHGSSSTVISAPPPLPLERAAGTAPPPLPAERAAAPGDTYVSAADPIPPSPPLPIAVTGPAPPQSSASTLVSAGNAATIMPQRTVSLGEAPGVQPARPNPPLPPPGGPSASSVAPSGAAGASARPALGSVPPPGGLLVHGRTQVSAGTLPATIPPTSAKTTPVVVVAPPSVPPPSTMSNTVEAPAPSFPEARPPSLPPQITSPESWPPNVHTTSGPSRDEAALVANAQRALAMGKSEEALRLAEECLLHFPHSVPAMQLAATELARLGRWARLADLYERVIGQLHDPAGAAQLCSALARICSAQLDDQDRAQQAVLRGLSRQPDHPGLLAELASQEERRGNWKLAAEHSRRALRNAPLDARLIREALRRFQQTGQLELAWNAACILGYLGQASEQERSLVNARRTGNLPQPKRALNGSDFQLGLTPLQPSTPLHQVLTKLYGPLHQAKLPKPKQQQQLLGTVQQEDVRQSTTTLARTFAWSCQLLDIAPPALFLTSGDALPAVLNVDQPAWCVGRTIGRGLSLPELAFLWTRALIRTRPENRIATCIASPAELTEAVEAAALLAGVATRASGNAKKLSKALKRHADRSLWNELRAPLQAVLNHSLDEALLRWYEGLERTANRLGLLACGDPELAARTLARYADESVLDRQAQIHDLLGFTMSTEYEALTARLLRA